MSAILVIQRNAHLAASVRFDQVQGRDGQDGRVLPRATFIAISNERRGPEPRQDQPTAIRWTLWGKPAENAARYLGKGSHVNVVGSVRGDSYSAADGSTAHALVFTADIVDYLDTRSEAEERRERQAFVAEMDAAGDSDAPHAPTQAEAHSTATTAAATRAGKATRTRQA
jgi:single-strand DNA-binding protein